VKPKIKRTAAPAPPASRRPIKIQDEALGFAGLSDDGRTKEERTVWKLPSVPPGVLPKGKTPAKLAQDQAPLLNQTYTWAIGGAWAEGLEFMGYPYLAELTQRAEYRRPAEILAKAMTRKWIRITSKSEEGSSDRIKQIEDAFVAYDVQDRMKIMAEHDGFFGRAQLYLDMGDLVTQSPEELRTPLPYALSKVSMNTPLQRITPVEPIWTYPNMYNSTDPLRPDFYKPDTWFVMGKEVHKSRLLTFVSRPVPDMLKPVYAFGGLSLSQICKPYVDNWLRTRQSVSDLIRNFSVTVLQTNMAEVLNGGAASDLFRRAHMFNRTRDNRGLMLIDKELEDLVNVSVPLGTLDKLQAQSQEHMAAVVGIPLIILFAITPSGLNASSESELDVFEGWILSQQESFLRPHLTTILQVVQLSKFGNIDPDITFQFEPLSVMDILEIAQARNTDADADVKLIDAGVISPQESRARIAKEEDSPYAGLDPNDLPIPPTPDDGDLGSMFGSTGASGTEIPEQSPVTGTEVKPNGHDTPQLT